MNDGIFGTNSGQKKALNNEGEGAFDTNSGARKATGGALVKVDNGKGSALAAFAKEGANKMARIIAEGKDAQMDAQKVMYFLASYGEGDELGKFVFSSTELVGRAAYERDVRDITYVKDPVNDPAGIGSGIPQESVRKVPVAALPPSDDGLKLAMSGIRLRDAVHILRDRDWVATEEDGDFGQDCDFSTVKLTAKGREIALVAVKKMLTKGGVDFTEGFGGMPDLFDGSFGSAPQLTDMQQQQAMLTKAKVTFAVEHDEKGDEGRGTATIVVNGKPAFTFNAEGSLLNTSKDASIEAKDTRTQAFEQAVVDAAEVAAAAEPDVVSNK